MTDIQGLSQSKALARRARGLGNDAPLQTTRSYAQILRQNAFTFINVILFAIGLALILMDRPGIRPALCVARAALSAADDAEGVD